MKFCNKLQKEAINYLLSEYGFHHIGYTGTHFIASFPKGEEEDSEFFTLKKDHSARSFARVLFHFFASGNEEVNCKIQLYLNSHLEWDTFFEGWIETIDEFKLLLKMVGL